MVRAMFHSLLSFLDYRHAAKDDMQHRLLRSSSCTLLIAGALLATATLPAAQSSGQSRQELRATGPRPIAMAMEQLGRRHGLLISYEDPRYLCPDDQQDVTARVRKDIREFPAGGAPKVLIPRPSSVQLAYETSPSGQPKDTEGLINNLLAQHAAAGGAGHFRVERRGERYSVIPTDVRNSEGQWRQTSSLLDVLVDIPRAERSIAETVKLLCAQLQGETGLQVRMGTIPTNAFMQRRVTIGATGEMARSVLQRLLARQRLACAWQLFHDPGLDWQVLNVHCLTGKR